MEAPMNKIFSILLVLVAVLLLQGCATGTIVRATPQYHVNEHGEAVQVRAETTRGQSNGLCGRNEMWSTARHLCMSSTGTKFLYVDSSTGYMEVDLQNCGRPGMFATVSQAILTAVIQAAAVEAIENPYAAYGVAGVANSFVGAVSQNRLGKKCSIPAQYADANNFSERVRKEIIREQLKVGHRQVSLENEVRQEMGLQLLGVSQQSGPQPGTQQWCDVEANRRYAEKGGVAWVQSACAQRGQTFGPTTMGSQAGCGCR